MWYWNTVRKTGIRTRCFSSHTLFLHCVVVQVDTRSASIGGVCGYTGLFWGFHARDLVNKPHIEATQGLSSSSDIHTERVNVKEDLDLNVL